MVGEKKGRLLQSRYSLVASLTCLLTPRYKVPALRNLGNWKVPTQYGVRSTDLPVIPSLHDAKHTADSTLPHPLLTPLFLLNPINEF